MSEGFVPTMIDAIRCAPRERAETDERALKSVSSFEGRAGIRASRMDILILVEHDAKKSLARLRHGLGSISSDCDEQQ